MRPKSAEGFLNLLATISMLTGNCRLCNIERHDYRRKMKCIRYFVMTVMRLMSDETDDCENGAPVDKLS